MSLFDFFFAGVIVKQHVFFFFFLKRGEEERRRNIISGIVVFFFSCAPTHSHTGTGKKKNTPWLKFLEQIKQRTCVACWNFFSPFL